MSKSASSSFKYNGDLADLRQACRDACAQLSLNIKSDRDEGSGFVIEAREKMKWLTTNWPTNLTARAARSGDDWAVVVSSGTFMFSLTQDFNNRHRAEEFASVIKTLAPDSKE